MESPLNVRTESGIANYFTVTYMELFHAHVLDVHLPNMLIGVSASIEVPLVTILGRRIHASYSQIADYITISALSRTVFDIPVGIIVEYVGVRNVMFLCLLLNVVASLVGFHVANSVALAVFCVLSGLSLGGFFLARHIFVAGISSKQYRGLLMSILSGLLRWSHVLGPVAAGLCATYWGDVRYSFLVAAVLSAAAFASLAIATFSSSYQHICEHSCAVSARATHETTPVHSDDDEALARPGGAAAAALGSCTLRPSKADHDSTPLLLSPSVPPAIRPSATTMNSIIKSEGLATSRSVAAAGIVGQETSVTLPPPASASYLHPPGTAHCHTHGTGGPMCCQRGCVCVGPGCRHPRSSAATDVSNSSLTSSVVHPNMGASRVHHFRMWTLWTTFTDCWSVIWRLGLYVVLVTAIRANRKLLLSFAGMQLTMSDAQISYLIGFSFIFDALLFPLGGLVMDMLGRQFAMVPIAVGLGSVFCFLPFAKTEAQLYVVACTFGMVDALGCGLLMTLTADRAPPRYSAPFFGIMRTLQDMGHAVGARGASQLMRHAGFNACCWTLTAVSLFTAAWGIYGVPPDLDVPPVTPRLERAMLAEEKRYQPLHMTLVSPSQSFSGTSVEAPLLTSNGDRSGSAACVGVAATAATIAHSPSNTRSYGTAATTYA